MTKRKLTDQDNPIKIANFEEEIKVFDYETEHDSEQFTSLAKEHGIFLYHKTYHHKVDENLKKYPVFVPIRTSYYICNYSGYKRVKKQEVNNKKKRQVKKLSIKRGCTARYIKTVMVNGKTQIKYRWKHINHDPTTIYQENKKLK